MKNIVFVVAHPDDMAYGMGGTAWLLKDKYNLHVLCATRGERGLPGICTESETAVIRQNEEKKASGNLLGAKITFLDRMDREVFADKTTSRKIASILTELNPAAVFTIWPVDAHPDHSAVSELTKKAIFLSELDCELIFCEERMNSQTSQFQPDIYVNISSVMDKKLKMIRCHECQNTDDNMAKWAIRQSGARGMESCVDYAEGYKTILPINTTSEKSILHTI
ncbi:MAG: PIG-L family deacetylase [Kiritimatiellae bacterium]|jgi:LmbE family N-acetylglucosaminyl deacetylase|nr:PIG-L family deacetylase [Kiritimatiellia bacterium]